MMSKETCCSPNNVIGLGSSSLEYLINQFVIKKFKRFVNARVCKKYIKRNRGPNKPKPKRERILRELYKRKTSIMSTAMLKKIENGELIIIIDFTLVIERTDKTTLEYWIIHYRLD